MFDNAGFHFDLVAQKVLVIESTDGSNLVFMGLKQEHFQKPVIIYLFPKKEIFTHEITNGTFSFHDAVVFVKPDHLLVQKPINFDFTLQYSAKERESISLIWF